MAKIVYVDWRDRQFEPEIIGVYEDESMGVKARENKEYELTQEGYVAGDDFHVWVKDVEIFKNPKEKETINSFLRNIMEFKDRATGRKFLYFLDKDTNIYYVFENNNLFFKGETENIFNKIEELRGPLEYIAFPDTQANLYNPCPVDMNGHYRISNSSQINGIYYRTDLFIDNSRVWTRKKSSDAFYSKDVLQLDISEYIERIINACKSAEPLKRMCFDNFGPYILYIHKRISLYPFINGEDYNFVDVFIYKKNAVKREGKFKDVCVDFVKDVPISNLKEILNDIILLQKDIDITSD